MAVGAYATVKIQDAVSWPLAASCCWRRALVTAVAGRARRRRGGAPARPLPRGRDARARGRAARRSRRRFSDFLGGSNGLTVDAADPAGSRSARRSRSSAGRRGSPASPRSSPTSLLANLVRSGYGRAFRAVRDDEIAAQLAGYHVARTQVAAFVVSAACAGLAGGLLVVVTSLVAPGAFPLSLSVALLTGVILGGAGSLVGAIWGAAALVLVPTWADDAEQGALAVAQRPGQPRAGHLRRRAHRRDARRPRRAAGRAARARPAAARLLGTTIARPRAARKEEEQRSGGQRPRCSRRRRRRRSRVGACGSDDDSGGGELGLVEAASRPPRRPASPPRR